MTDIISPQQIKFYEENGYLLLPQFVSEAACDKLIFEAAKLIHETKQENKKTIFSTRDQQHAKDQYFLDSSYDIHFFYEKQAIDDAQNLLVSAEKSINKIGHALHDLNPVFNAFSRSENLAQLCSALNLQSPLLLQSMYICKQPFIGGEVVCHQDATYLHTQNKSVVGLWFALEKATIENGCLWALPGGHLQPLKARFKREGVNCHTETYDHSAWDMNKLVPLEVDKGSLILLHSHLPHMSHANLSAKSRQAYTLHVMCGKDLYTEDNWLQRPLEYPFAGF